MGRPALSRWTEPRSTSAARYGGREGSMYAAKAPTDIGRSRSDLRPGLEAQIDRIGEATGRLVAAFRSAVQRGLTLGTSTAAGRSPAGDAGAPRTPGPSLPDG